MILLNMSINKSKRHEWVNRNKLAEMTDPFIDKRSCPINKTLVNFKPLSSPNHNYSRRQRVRDP